MSKTAQVTARPAWGSQAKALPLADVARMLGVEQSEIRQMVAEGLLSVCVNAPPQIGIWRVTSGPWDEDTRRTRKFPGRYGRLSTREATECLASEWVTVYSLNLEPASLKRYADDSQTVCTPLSNTAPDGIRIQASDLLVSQLEFERYRNRLVPRGDADLDPRERASYERLLYVLAREARHNLENPHAAEETIQHFAATIGAKVPMGKGAIASKLKAAVARAAQDAIEDGQERGK
ncbi:hypothetical protein PS647_03757 [Pseudomonas fluorescens]|uniref:hypothetical protein n=1 Tax=Pseudomonas fluorescens TaxID=294 RepID=UPI0012427DC8|nr:hypothetical protein [Pseudomonas fluorescens]VVN09303.1 hypothetical protein PS647_03757 [Pseudomonas fluorescens]